MFGMSFLTEDSVFPFDDSKGQFITVLIYDLIEGKHQPISLKLTLPPKSSMDKLHHREAKNILG